MDSIGPGAVAIMLGLFVGIALFVPYVWLSYRRRGRLTAWRIAGAASCLIYGLAIWTYTLLPLPDPHRIKHCLTPQLDPLRFIADVRKYGAATAAQLAHNPALIQLVFNVVFFVPLGFLLRAMWRRGVVVSLLAGLAVSLLVECTQGTGVWGLFPCAYRLFDVDDLATNTLGAVVGSLLAWPLLRRRARRAAGAPVVPDAVPRRITVWRRALGFLSDGLATLLLVLGTGTAIEALQLYLLHRRFREADAVLASTIAWAAVLALQLLVTLASGRTIGDHAVAIRYVPRAAWEAADAGARRRASSSSPADHPGGAADAAGPLPPRDPGVKRAARRLGRFCFGIGGFGALMAVPAVRGGWAALFFTVSLLLLCTTHGHGGLPGLLTGQRPVDARTHAALLAAARAQAAERAGD
ncbi:MAG: VanZ family protein [Bifidobacteriaceae bacterium]|jgi:glycopeptide antibiotics resistance protein|nr:VanZ family protein [Bifidobacteriaceae bacterium]